jgi:hypothetical protein
MIDPFDLSGGSHLRRGFAPRQCELLQSGVEARGGPDEQYNAWTTVARQKEARAADCGEAAAREHLNCGLSDLAGRFLGQGSWAPSL